ncbi:hypothetical protein Misp01_42800 [Microtetraspora sp. NBRC 13810]|uniref:hypothetical protein n=1 Tax=Microtetraspora sp. NBRC 13810 TaxID=3030990 RepID=UPI0024A2A5BC|nr:hypothetical protein [Microtetraspora sp. NBRC 13810]GLW09151.1 hypothetical protein Misp01_42800 [Microtetraspora sp. NBRC 13810]
MPLPNQPVDGTLVHRPRPGGTNTGKADISGDVYCELSGLHYTIHLSKQAVIWIGGMKKLFNQYLKAAMEVLGDLAPLFEAISAYIDVEAQTIKAVSDRVSDGRVKLEGYIPDPAVVPEPDPGYVPPGSWDPPDPVNGLRWWTVNSINLYNGHWAFTATNSNPDESSVSSIYFSTAYDGNSMNADPQDFRDTYGWPCLKDYAQFDSGLDTCTFVPRTGMWWLFNGTYCARTDGTGSSVTWAPSKLTDTWAGLSRIDSGEFGQEEKDHWANGISCATTDGDGYYWLTAGNRVVVLEPSSGDMLPIPGWDRPRDLTEIWPALQHLEDAGIMDDQTLKALCWAHNGNRAKWFLVFHSVLFTNYPDDNGDFGYSYMACQSNTSDWFYSWNAMASYLNGPWPYPSCY